MTTHFDDASDLQPAPQAVSADAYDLDALIKQTLSRVSADGPQDQDVPRWKRVHMPQKTYNDTQWGSLLQALQDRAQSAPGRALCAHTAPISNLKAVQRRMQEVFEGMTLIQSDERAPLRGLSDVRKALAHVLRDGVLVGEDLWAIAQNCDVAARCAQFYEQRTQRAPYLYEVSQKLDGCGPLRQTLQHAIDPNGKLSDKASPDISRLRRAVQNQHDRVRSYLERTLKSQSMEQTLQDDYFTLRDDRYVLPVRRSNKNDVPGIVHGYSSSGQTAYVEPNDLIELNNQLRWSQIELQEEEQRILRRLSQMVATHAEALRQSADVLAYLDYLNALSRLAADLDCTVPDVSTDRVALKQARHPLLVLKFAQNVAGTDDEPEEAIPNDLSLSEDKRVLIVSGPNTGGKTVFLKTFGLCALMARCGMLLPCAAGSSIPLFRAVFTDIGDEQSIERDLSTFSAHLTNINTFLDDCGNQSLVLLDELFSGTDPMQGAALAVSLLEELTIRGARVVVTTHLESLKTLAFQKDAYANASMGFSLETLAPTYQVTYGLPGSSYAVRIAERLGLPDVIIERARRVLDGQEHQSVEQILTALEDKRRDMEQAQRQLKHERKLAEDSKRKFQRKYEKLLAKDKDMLSDQARRLKRDLDKAHKLVREQIKSLREGETQTLSRKDLQQRQQSLDTTQKALEQTSQYARPVKPQPSGMVRVQPEDLTDGLEVYAHTFKRKARVVGDQQGAKKSVRVQMGNLKANVDLTDLFYPHEDARRKQTSRQTSRPPKVGTAAPEKMLLPQNSNNTVDLRGMRVDAALEKLQLFLDSAFLSDKGGIYIIHGHGSGALKRAVRAELPSSPYVSEFRRGEHGEGGDGVTIAYVKQN